MKLFHFKFLFWLSCLLDKTCSEEAGSCKKHWRFLVYLLGVQQNWERLYPATLFPFSSSLRPPTVSLPGSITLGSNNIPFSDSARNLGVILDSNLSLKKHVIKICQTAYFELKRISAIRRFLTEDAAKTLNCYLLYPVTARLLQLSPHGYTWFCHPASPENSKFCCKTRSFGTKPPVLNTSFGFPFQNVLNIKSLVCVSAL